MSCKTLIQEAGVTQAEFATAIAKNQSTASRIINGKVEPGKSTIDATLAFFAKRLGRTVSYDEAFGKPRKRRVAA